MARTTRSGDRRGQRGFSYIGLLILLALIGISAAALGESWSASSQRERERRLLWVGHRIQAAIIEFHDTTPAGQQPRFPKSFAELLADPRWPVTHRHLRAAYGDPISNDGDWVILRAPDGGIAGVHSRSTHAPFKHTDFPLADVGFEDAVHYSDWYFGYPIEDIGSRVPASGVPASGLVLPGIGGGTAGSDR
jgi:type II secretory pathway pseudopilin PulG